MNLNNIEIRTAIEKKRLRFYEVADEIGINTCTFSRWLQRELSEEKKKRVLDAIARIK
jgi:DNA-binding LacI/PurR family transcriptional regulator